MLVQLDESARLWNFECVSSTSNLFILSSFKNEVFVQFSILAREFCKKKKLYKEIVGFGFTPVFRKFWGKIISKNAKVYIKIRLFFFFNIVIF